MSAGSSRAALVTLLLSATLLAAGCTLDPERNNPLDPGSSSYEGTGTLVVEILNYSETSLDSVWVKLQDYGEAQQSNSNGLTVFTLPPGTYTFTAERVNYVDYVGEITVQPRRITTETITMNGKPRFNNIWMTTEVKVQAIGPTLYSYDVNMEVYDPDGVRDIFRVATLHPDGFTHGPIGVTGEGNSALYSYVVNLAEDPGKMLDVLGKDFRFVIIDDHEATDTSYAEIRSFFNYTGVDQVPIPEPSYTIGNMEFEWYNPDLLEVGYKPNTWLLRIFTTTSSTPFIEKMVTFTDEQIETQGTFSTILTETEPFQPYVQYHWELSLFDPFGNVCRSSRRAFEARSDLEAIAP